MKIIYKGNSSGDEQIFPIVGKWKSGVEKTVTENQGDILIGYYPLLIKKVNSKEIGKKIEETTEENIIETKNILFMSRDELIAECVFNNIDPPDRANKSELRELLETQTILNGGGK